MSPRARGILSTLVVCSAGIEARAAEPVTVAGAVQFWARRCNGVRCELPEALGEKQPVSGTLAPPAAAGQIGRQTVTLTAADGEEGTLTLRLQLLWPAPPDGSTPYLAAQGNLTRSAGGVERPVAECSQYHSQDMARFFPVGACAGYVEEGDGVFRELGVTFYKD